MTLQLWSGKFCQRFSVRNPRKYDPLMLCWHIFVVNSDITLSTCNSLYVPYERGCIALCNNKLKTQFSVWKTKLHEKESWGHVLLHLKLVAQLFSRKNSFSQYTRKFLTPQHCPYPATLAYLYMTNGVQGKPELLFLVTGLHEELFRTISHL